MTEHHALGCRQRRQIAFLPAPADIRVASKRAEPGARRIDDHRVERLRKRQRLQQIALNDADIERPGGDERATQQFHPAPANVAGDQEAGRVHCGGDRGRFPAWRGAGVEDAHTRPGRCQERHELRRFVLDEEPAFVSPASPKRMARRDNQRVGCEAAGADRDVLRLEARDEFWRVEHEAVRAQGQRRRRVVETQPRLGAVEAQTVVPTSGQPPRVRQRHAEIVQRGGTIGGDLRLRRQRKSVAPARDGAKNGIHEAGCAPFAGAFRQVHRIVHHGGGRDAREMEQLIGTEPQDLHDFAIESIDGVARELDNHMIQGGSPPLNTGCDFCGQCLVAIVLELIPGEGDSRRQIGAARRHRPENLVGGDPRRRDHGAAVSRSPRDR